MPYPAEHKAQTRARIVESARIMFNRSGFEQVSIDDIMKQAGLTRGGFIPEGDRDAPRKAMLIVNLCVGGMIIARTTDDPQLRDTLRATARSEAKRMLYG